MLKLIMFDLDGTCHNTISKIKHCFEYSINKIGGNTTWEYARNFLGMPHYIFAEKVAPDKSEEYIKYYIDEYMSMEEAPLYEGTVDTINRLKEKYKVVLVTGKPRDLTLKCFEVLGISNLFDYLVCGDDTEKTKPNPEPLYKAMDYYNCKANEALYIGDGLFDVEATKRANVPIIAVTWGGTAKKRLLEENPAYIADTWNDVEKIIEKLQ